VSLKRKKKGLVFMPKKNDVNKMKESLARLNERAKSAESDLKKLEAKRKKMQDLIADEERKKRTHNLCGIGGLVYKYFGEDITPDEFKEILDFLFAIDEVQNFVNAEKEKRILRDNSSAAVSEK